MPTLAEWSPGQVIKMLLIGDAASGKTGALASLVTAGYNLRIIDFDKGVNVLRNVLKDKSPTLLDKVDVVSFSDEYKNVGGRITCTRAKAWAEANKWMSNYEPHGVLEKWTPRDILVIDSLTFAGKAAMNWVSSVNGRLGQSPYQSDYLEGQRLVENMCALLHSDSVGCNIICITHIRELAKNETKTDNKGNAIRIPISGTEKSYPETGTGQALSPTIGRYFNSILSVEVNYGRREIFTKPHGNLALKSAGGSAIPDKYTLETGLADYFRAIRGDQ
jgi:hypothetical protein